MKTYYKMTIGVKEFCEEKKIRWLIDAILSYQIYTHVKIEPFQSWKLSRIKSSNFLLTCDDGNGNILITDKIPCLGFEDDNCKIWLCDKVLMLPNEY